MRLTCRASLFALALTALAGTASAQFYLTGSLTQPDWSPGTATGLDGSTGGAVAQLEFPAFASGTTSLTINGSAGAAPNHALTAGNLYFYKMATSGFGTVIPSGPAAVLRAPADTTTAITFTARDSAYGDGYLPDPSEGFIWSSATPLVFTATPGEWRVVGSILTELGAAADWSYADGIAITDAGNTTTGDGIWATAVYTNIPPGAYEVLVIEDGDFDPKIGVNGLDGGSNLPVNILDTSDTVQFLVNINTGRVKVDVQSTVTIDPGFYASFDSNAQTYSPAEKLAPVAPGVFGRTFTIATAGNHWVRINDQDTNVYPAGAVELTAGATGPDGYTFKTTTPNQVVRVFFDTNTYSDGFLPATNFVSVVADDSGASLLNVFTDAEIVGALQSEFLTGDASIGDWTPTPTTPGMELTSVGDGIWSGTFTALLSGTGLEWKVAARTSDWNGSWAESANEQVEINPRGLTHHIGLSPNFPTIDVTAGQAYSFTIDLKAGRAAVTAGSTAPTPTRAGYLTGVTSVTDWMLH